MDSDGKLLLDRRSAASLLSISTRALDYYIACGRIVVRRAGRKVLIPRSECEKFARRDHPPVSSTVSKQRTAVVPS